jgi:hypothetical protein
MELVAPIPSVATLNYLLCRKNVIVLSSVYLEIANRSEDDEGSNAKQISIEESVLIELTLI